MYIISKHKDYYDSVAHSKGIDKTIIYNRKTEEIADSEFYNDVRALYRKNQKIKCYFPSEQQLNYYSKKGLKEFHTAIIGFCGKIYPILIATYYVPATSRYTMVTEEKVIIHDLDKIREMCDKKISYFNPKKFSNYEEMFTSKNILDIFFKYKTPCFMLTNVDVGVFGIVGRDNKNLILNPCLKDYEFFKVVDPFQAFQEIEMFISGVLGINSQKIIEVSDKSKIEGHGFDYKTSFRKEKEPKK